MLATLLATTIAIHAPADTVIRRGAPLPDMPATSLVDVLASPAKYSKTPVLVEGVIVRSCTAMGCWMQLAPSKDAEGVRVDFGEKFFIPLKAAGMKARALGTASLKQLSKEEADHLEKEGGLIKRNADGTAMSVEFAATGVELRG